MSTLTVDGTAAASNSAAQRSKVDALRIAALAAELTNHLVDGVVLIPGAAGTLPELQQVGFHYAK